MPKVTPLNRNQPCKPQPGKRTGKPQPPRQPSKVQTSGPGFRGKSPLQIIVYGPPGVGKTDFCANFPKTAFIIDPQEEGVRTLQEFGSIPDPVFIEETETFSDTISICEDIAAGQHDIETAVFDSFTGFEKLAFHYHCEKYFDNDWRAEGFYAFARGPKNAAKTDIPRYLDALTSVRKSGINVILICHSEEKTYENPTGPNYARFTPVCDKESWKQVSRWAKGIYYYAYDVDVETAKKKDRTNAHARGKVRNTEDRRFLNTAWSPAFDAKCQYGLQPCIDMGGSGTEAFENFATAFDKCGQR